MITPTKEAYGHANPSDSEKDTESNSTASKRTIDVQSILTNGSSVPQGTMKHDGHAILHLPQLESAINSIACCKHCAKLNGASTMEDFKAFCESEREKIVTRCKPLPMESELEIWQQEMNVSTFYQQWQRKQQIATKYVPIHNLWIGNSV